MPNNPNRNDDADRVLTGLMVLRGIKNEVDSLATIKQIVVVCKCSDVAKYYGVVGVISI